VEEPELPRVTTVGSAPADLPGAVTVLTALRSGALALDGAPLPFMDLGGRLSVSAAAGPRGSDVHLVIRADRRVPWRTVQWLVQAGAVAGFWRLLFGALPREGSREGTFAVFLPIYRGLPDPGFGGGEAPPRPFAVQLTPDGEPVRRLASVAVAGPPPVPRPAGLAGFLEARGIDIGKPVEEEETIIEIPPEPK
jgi:hypothetical protein